MAKDDQPRNTESGSSDAESPVRKLLDNGPLILAMLFLVTLFLGLPFLWQSRAFSAPMKILITIATLIWTALVFWAFALVMLWCYHRIFG